MDKEQKEINLAKALRVLYRITAKGRPAKNVYVLPSINSDTCYNLYTNHALKRVWYIEPYTPNYRYFQAPYCTFGKRVDFTCRKGEWIVYLGVTGIPAYRYRSVL